MTLLNRIRKALANLFAPRVTFTHTINRYVTLWRKTGEESLDWDFHVSLSLHDAEATVANLKKRGVHQYGTYPLGPKVEDLSSDY